MMKANSQTKAIRADTTRVVSRLEAELEEEVYGLERNLVLAQLMPLVSSSLSILYWHSARALLFASQEDYKAGYRPRGREYIRWRNE